MTDLLEGLGAEAEVLQGGGSSGALPPPGLSLGSRSASRRTTSNLNPLALPDTLALARASSLLDLRRSRSSYTQVRAAPCCCCARPGCRGCPGARAARPGRPCAAPTPRRRAN
jgi:hypothetical protein